MNSFIRKIVVKSIAIATVAFQANLYATPDSDLKDILEEVRSIQGSFHQKIQTEQGKLLQESHGKVWLKKPKHFRWEVRGKDPRLVIGDGKKVWDYDQDLEQVTVQKMSEGETAAPIFFLTGEVQTLSKEFVVNTIPSHHGICMSESHQCFLLKPKTHQAAFQWIRIGFKERKLRELEVLDQLGQRSIFLFDHVIVNADISIKQFQFTPPPGVDIVSH